MIVGGEFSRCGAVIWPVGSGSRRPGVSGRNPPTPLTHEERAPSRRSRGRRTSGCSRRSAARMQEDVQAGPGVIESRFAAEPRCSVDSGRGPTLWEECLAGRSSIDGSGESPRCQGSDDACLSGPGVRGPGALPASGASVAMSTVASARALGCQARLGGGVQERLGGQVGSGVVLHATEQRDAPVSALDLKALHDDPLFINVRAAGDRDCSPSLRGATR